MDERFIKGGYYHIFNRGCNRAGIFFNEGNYIYLLKKIKASRDKYGVSIIAYCLMPNHYHFLLRQDTEQPLSNWLKQLFNGYVQAVNKQQNRTGTLFQGRPKHVYVNNEAYLIHVIRYIHYNPVKAGLTNSPEAWKFSNYAEWIGIRNGTLIDRELARNYFQIPEDYCRYMKHYMIDEKFSEKLRPYLLHE